MAGGIIRVPGGGAVKSPAGKALANGAAQVVSATSIKPQAVSILSDAAPGTVIAPLTFEGFSFGATNPTLNLVLNAGGRVALAGSWAGGYALVVGAGALAPAGNYTLALQFQGDTKIYNITLNVALASSAATLFTASVENADTVTSWVDQELSFGQPFVKGDVPSGTVVRAMIGGQQVPCQMSERIFWNDGSLKHALVRMLVPAIPAGGSSVITWQRTNGTWNDSALHTSTAAITGNVSLEYALTSWKGRTAANVLTVERGPLILNSNTMFAPANAPWTDKVMSGPVCNEWRVSDMAAIGTANGAKHGHQGGYLYARAWGGTATKPARIQFLFRTIYGWSTDVAADEQGLQVNVDLKVNGTVVRGNAIGTAGWGNVKTWKGGFLVSAGPEGDMDWFDVATTSFVAPPAIVYRHNVAYGIESKFFPPFDTDNPAFPMTAGGITYLPGKRGPLRPVQDDVADHEMICWTMPKPPARCIAAHARGTAAQILGHQRYCRAAGFGMGAMTSVAVHRETRNVVSYLPPGKQTNLGQMGTSIYGQGKPAEAAAALRPEITNLDPNHFPSMAFWPALSEGDQHWLDLMYHEVTLPGAFETPADGFFGLSDRAKIPFGGICWRGQIRGVGHTARPLVSAVGLGRPSDPHWQMALDYLNHWAEMTREIPLEEDAWRGGIDRTDGRRFQDLQLLRPNNEPTYKFWMHTFGLHALSFGYGITENAIVKERADWWAHAPIVMAGGYHNDSGPEYDLMKPDPLEVAGYLSICMNGLTDSVENRRYWLYGQWANALSDVTYGTDGTTLTFTGPSQGLTAMLDGMIITVSGLRYSIVNGVRQEAEPFWVVDNTKVPSGLTRGIPYYAVQSSGNTCKIALSPGGTPVTFNPGGTAMVGQCGRRTVGGLHPMRDGQFASTDANNYLIQVMCALDMYAHYAAPDDARARLARVNLFNLKDTSAAPTAYDERGKTIVPRTATLPPSAAHFDSATLTVDSSSDTFDKDL